MDNTIPLFSYLDDEHIKVDKEEFTFQFQSHPDYPSLLAISDTLTFFDIPNAAIKVKVSEMDLLPNTFIAVLKEGRNSFLSFIKKKNNLYSFSNEEYKLSKASEEEFVPIWDDIILLIEKEDNFISNKKDKKFSYSLVLPFLLLMVALLFTTFSTFSILCFYILPIIGFIFSLGALKDLFSAKSELLNKFCNVTSSTSCESVVNSSKWILFESVSFSDLSVTFFATQITALFLMSLNGAYKEFFLIQQVVLLVLSFPVILTSIYYQKFVEKKWCPICLSISSIIILELVYVLFLNNFSLLPVSLFGATFYLFIAISILMIWYSLKKLLKQTNKLKEAEFKANRFKRNYPIFKNMLVASEHYNLPKNPLVFGNPNASLKISIITSPYCGHCTEPHYLLKSILDKYGDVLAISILYSLNPKNKRLKPFATNVLNNGQEHYYEAMEYWYKTRDDDKWLEKYQTKFDSSDIEHMLEMQHQWFTKHSFNFTPCLFVNGYKYPEAYDIADLPFYIDELLDDTTILIAETEKL